MLKYQALGGTIKLMKFRQIKGQGLIEIMMTLLIIAGSVIALIRFQNYLAYNNGMANQQATATHLAVNQIETLRDYSALTGTNSYANIASGTSSYAGTSATYTITWTVTSFTNPTYKRIAVTVSWTDRYGNSQSTQLISQIAQIDPAYSSTIMAI
jgi:Tfp pilus assembly protein PilV